MSDETKSKVIERNRPPRVQIAYEIYHGNSPTTIDLPFVMGVMADLAGASETPEASKPVSERKFCEELKAKDFPKFMERLAPRVKARVKNTLPPEKLGEERDEERAIDLTFKSMGDFAPDKIAGQDPHLAKLLRMRAQLVELLGFMGGRLDAEKRISDLLKNEPLLQQIAGSEGNKAER